MAALDRLRVVPWPFAGPAWLREGDEALLFDAWRHLGSARDDAELAELLGQPLPTFERDVYLILQAAVARMTPLA
jgi:DNA polymerase-3 subunit epsilon